MSLLSIIAPCYNEEESIFIFYEEFLKIYEDSIYPYDNNMQYELIFIDDGSEDNTLDEIKSLAEKNENIKYVSFSRNFGKESALYAGLKHSSGDYVVVMDVDLQDPPSLLFDMVKIIEEEDYDCVASRRVSRKGEPVIRSFFARMFYKLINLTSKLDLVDGARDFRLMKRSVVDAILELSEYNRFSKGIFNWVGFKTKWLEYENIERVKGETSWSFWSLFIYSIEGIVSFTTLPLSISTFLGILFSFIAFIGIIYIIITTLLYGNPVSGWPSTICIILLIGGVQLFSIGILGQYLGKTYIESKKRPIYLTRESNFEFKK